MTFQTRCRSFLRLQCFIRLRSFAGLKCFIGFLVSLCMILLLQIFMIQNLQGLAFGATEEPPEAMIEALKQRSLEMDEREARIKEREARLKLLEEEIRVMLGDNQKIVNRYKKLKEEADQKEAERLSDKAKKEEVRLTLLAKIYQSMGPKEAASRIAKLKESTAINLLRKIKAKVAAKILSNMSVGKAARYTEVFIPVKE